jgi:hypothetical protein
LKGRCPELNIDEDSARVLDELDKIDEIDEKSEQFEGRRYDYESVPILRDYKIKVLEG